jgi:hypothetical protein
MKKFAILVLSVCLLALVPPTDSVAAGFCPGRPNGKCPPPRKVREDSRDNYTVKQREAMRRQYNLLCMKKYPGSHLDNINYKYRRYTCTY